MSFRSGGVQAAVVTICRSLVRPRLLIGLVACLGVAGPARRGGQKTATPASPTAPPATAARIHRELTALKSAHVQNGPQRLTISGAPAFKVVYRTQSAPNPLTGKRVTLTVDRYYLAHAGKEAIIDLGTPLGVDNVDAYRLMIESFRWS